MNPKKWLWIITSLFVWFLLATYSTLYLIKLRARLSLSDLQSDISIQNNTALANIQLWLRISSSLNGTGIGKNSTALTTVFKLLSNQWQLDSSASYPTNIECLECNAVMQSNLKSINQALSELKNKDNEYRTAKESLDNLQTTRSKIIELHSLLAKDFADLIGSTSYYQNKGKLELSYYQEGPFKWLPLLDTSSKSSSNQALQEETTLAIEGYSEKLENLRKQSRALIEEYQELASKIQNNAEKLAQSEKDLRKTKKFISNSILQGLNSELSS